MRAESQHQARMEFINALCKLCGIANSRDLMKLVVTIDGFHDPEIEVTSLKRQTESEDGVVARLLERYTISIMPKEPPA